MASPNPISLENPSLIDHSDNPTPNTHRSELEILSEEFGFRTIEDGTVDNTTSQTATRNLVSHESAMEREIEIQYLKGEVENICSQRDSALHQVRELHASLNTERKAARQTREELLSIRKQLQELQAKQTSHTPGPEYHHEADKEFIRIGKAVRMRYMALNTQSQWLLPCFPERQSAIDLGDKAINNENAKADMAIFALGPWLEKEDGDMFISLYGTRVSEYPKAIENWERFLRVESKYNALRHVFASELEAKKERARDIHDRLRSCVRKDGSFHDRWNKWCHRSLDEFDDLVKEAEAIDVATYVEINSML